MGLFKVNPTEMVAPVASQYRNSTAFSCEVQLMVLTLKFIPSTKAHDIKFKNKTKKSFDETSIFVLACDVV